MADPFGGEVGEFGYWKTFPDIFDEVRESAADFADTMREEADALRGTYRRLDLETGEILRPFAQAAAAAAAAGAGVAGAGGRGAGGRGFGGFGEFDAGDMERARREQERMGLTMRRQTMYQLWYLRAMQQQIRVVDRLGRQVIRTATSWTFYAARAEEAANVAADMGRTHGELSTILEAQREATVRMRAELGEALLPAYKDAIGVVTSLKESVAGLSDGWQAAIGISTAAVGIFLKVGGAIAGAAVAGTMAWTAFQSLSLGMQAATLSAMQYGVTIGLIVAATAALSMGWSRIKSDLQEAADILRDHAMRWDMSREAMVQMAQEYYESLNLLGKAIFNLAGGMDAFIDRMLTGGSELGTVFEQAVKAAEDMVLPAAQAFQSLADAQSNLQNEMLTKRREYARVMERIDSGMYSAQDVAQATALQAQMRRLEIAGMETARAHKRQMGQIVVETLQAWQQIGRFTPERAYGMIEAAFLEFEMISPEALALGREFMQKYIPVALGEKPFEAALAESIAMVIPEEKRIVALEDNTFALNELTAALFGMYQALMPSAAYGPGEIEYAKLRTVGEELKTQGIMTRP